VKGWDDRFSLIVFGILRKHEHEHYSFVVINGIPHTNNRYIARLHRKALRIDERTYVSIFLKPGSRFGDLILGEHIARRLKAHDLRRIRRRFKTYVSKQEYLRAIEWIIKEINSRCLPPFQDVSS